ncbi:ubiquitin carboxyl-terminal hydrolase 25 [Typha latifolia]|uniref:ubiquitin carboxyl-terminal hydrolase 25 n=1 Tax=Typha latifolia TaxID=4733 RepID=UPI003C2CE127
MDLQMTWQNRRRKAGPPLGLKNLGNTCYLNSVLQCLTYTPPLAQFCLSSQHSSLCKSLFANREKECPFCILERQIARSLSIDGPLDAPSKIHKCLPLFADHFRWGRQEDSHEFLRYVIDACHNACLRLLKRLSVASANGNGNCNGATKGESGTRSTVMKEIFGGALLSQVKCLSCKGESNKTDEIMDISLDLFQSNSLKDALARFFQPEVLDGNNKYSCGKCEKLSVARKQMFILRAPNVLVIQLKRFEGIHGGKINRNIEFEEVLVLSRFMHNTSQDSQPEYNLFGSVVHSGFSPESGHYYAYIKDASGRWYCCNDAHVSLSSSQEVLSEKVYILFYLLSNQTPRSGKTGHPCNTTKSSDSNGSAVSPKLKSSELLKTPLVKPNGVSSKTCASTMLKNGRITPNPQIKQISLKNFDMKKVISNGKSNLEVNNNVSIGKDNKLSGLSSSGKSETVYEGEALAAPNGMTVNGNISSELVELNTGNKMSMPNGTGCTNLLQVKVHKSIETKILAHLERDPEHSSSSTTRDDHSDLPSIKRKTQGCGSTEASIQCSEEAKSLSAEDISCKTQITYRNHNIKELENLKEVLAGEASSKLLACGWVDNVHSFMRTRKRLCVQAAGSCPDSSLLRKQLKDDARRTFLSQIPESLKEHLVDRLRSFSQGKPFLDA